MWASWPEVSDVKRTNLSVRYMAVDTDLARRHSSKLLGTTFVNEYR